MKKQKCKKSNQLCISMLLTVFLTAALISHVIEYIPRLFYNYTVDLLVEAAEVERQNQIDEQYAYLLQDYNDEITSYWRKREEYTYRIFYYHEECMKYPAKLDLYHAEMDEYNHSMDEYNAALQKYNDDCVAYEERYKSQQEQYKYDVEDYPNKCLAEEKRQFREFIKNGMRFTCYGNTSSEEINHVGNEWDYDFTVYGSDGWEITLRLGDTVRVYSRITEEDKIPDVGTYSDSHYLKEEDFSNGFEINHTVYVRENNGRYTGNYASFEVTYKFRPIEDQFVPDESKYPEYPKEPEYDPPIFNVVEPVEPTVPPRPVQPVEPELPERPTRDSIHVAAPVRSIFRPTNREIYSTSCYPAITAVLSSVLILGAGYFVERRLHVRYIEERGIELENEWLRNRTKIIEKKEQEEPHNQQSELSQEEQEYNLISVLERIKSVRSISDLQNALKLLFIVIKKAGANGVLACILVLVLIVGLGVGISRKGKLCDDNTELDPRINISYCTTLHEKVEILKKEIAADPIVLQNSEYRESGFPFVGMHIAYLNRTIAGKISRIEETNDEVICYYAEKDIYGESVEFLVVKFYNTNIYVTYVEKIDQYWNGDTLDYSKFDKSVADKYSQ